MHRVAILTRTSLQGFGTPSSVSIWRQTVQNPDTQASRFQFAIQLSVRATSVTVTDGVSAVPVTIIATSDPDSGRFVNCPTPLVLGVSTTITCNFMALGSGVQVQTYTSRFSIALSSKTTASSAGTVSSIRPLPLPGATNTSDTSFQFQFSYTAPATSITTSLTFIVYYPNNGGPMITTQIPVIVTDVPDSTSSLDCGGGSGAQSTAYAPMICLVTPRKKGVNINSLATSFTPSVLSGPATIFSPVTPSAGSPMIFRIVFQQSYQRCESDRFQACALQV